VHALAAAPGSEALLCRHLPVEPDRSVRETILLALIRLGTADAASGLAGLLASEDAGLRNSALESLTAMPAEAARLLDRLDAASDPDVRIFGVILAAALPFAWVGGRLTDRLAREPDPNVCAAMAEALAETGDHRAVPALEAMRARFSDEPFLQFVAETVLRRLPREA
jgi:HEAT repeat protein